MAIEDRVSTGIDWPNRTAFKHYGSRLLRGTFLAVVASTWVGFWGIIVRLHLQQGDIASAVAVSLLFVLPALIGYASYLWPNLPKSWLETANFGH